MSVGAQVAEERKLLRVKHDGRAALKRAPEGDYAALLLMEGGANPDPDPDLQSDPSASFSRFSPRLPPGC